MGTMMISSCRSLIMLKGMLIHTTIYLIFIMLTLSDNTNLCSGTTESITNATTKKVRIRHREFLRGGDQTVTPKIITTTTEELFDNTTYDPEDTTAANWDLQEWRPPVVVNATANHTATLIFLHGIGDQGSHWAHTLTHIRPSNVKIICPTAKESSIYTFSKNSSTGAATSWFNRKSNSMEHMDDANQSTEFIHSIINEEIKNGIKPGKIMIGGFSQGGAMALYSALTFPTRLAGIICMSGWLPFGTCFRQYIHPVQRNIPILQGHGTKDRVVEFIAGNYTALILKLISGKAVLKAYPGTDHVVNLHGLRDMEDFFKEHLLPDTASKKPS